MNKLSTELVLNHVLNHQDFIKHADELGFSATEKINWSKPKNWKRWSKKRADDYETFDGAKFDFDIDDGGNINYNLLDSEYNNYISSNKSDKMKPWVRTFVMSHDVAEMDIMCVIMTTHDDTQIVGFYLHGD